MGPRPGVPPHPRGGRAQESAFGSTPERSSPTGRGGVTEPRTVPCRQQQAISGFESHCDRTGFPGHSGPLPEPGWTHTSPQGQALLGAGGLLTRSPAGDGPRGGGAPQPPPPGGHTCTDAVRRAPLGQSRLTDAGWCWPPHGRVCCPGTSCCLVPTATSEKRDHCHSSDSPDLQGTEPAPLLSGERGF